MSIELIIFSLDNTLFEVGKKLTKEALDYIIKTASEVVKVNGEMLKQRLIYHAEKIWTNSPYYSYFKLADINAEDALFLFFEENFPNIEDLQEWATFFRIESWYKAFKDCGVDDILYAEEAAVEFLTTDFSRYKLFPETVFVLEELLKRGFRLAVLTSGDKTLQMEKLINFNIEKYFEKIAVYDLIDKKAFDLILEECEVEKNNVLFVTNNFLTEVYAAKKAGIKTVLKIVEEKQKPSEIVPDFTILSLKDLISLALLLR